jgi:hypothetical protein
MIMVIGDPLIDNIDWKSTRMGSILLLVLAYIIIVSYYEFVKHVLQYESCLFQYKMLFFFFFSMFGVAEKLWSKFVTKYKFGLGLLTCIMFFFLMLFSVISSSFFSFSYLLKTNYWICWTNIFTYVDPTNLTVNFLKIRIGERYENTK